MAWLPEPDLDAALWEGPLDLLDTGAVRRDTGRGGLDPRALPEVAIGPPRLWPLPDVYPPEKMPATMLAQLDANDFYMVALHCSFRPLRDEVQIEWARFVAELTSDDPDSPAQAHAIHPEVIEDEVTRNRTFTLSPSLTFVGVDASIGSAAFGFEYRALEPRVFGAREPVTSPSWDYQPTRGHRLYGSRQMHLLIRTRRGTENIRARLHLVADISRERRLIGRAKARRDQAPLDVRLWPPS